MINILLLSAVILLSIFGVGCGMDHFGIDHRVECQDKSENVQKIRVAHNSDNSEFETINFDLAKLYSPPDILERFKPSMQIEFHYTLFISVIEGNRYFHLSEPQPNTFQVPSFNEPKPSHFKSVEALVQFLKMHPKAKIFNIVLRYGDHDEVNASAKYLTPQEVKYIENQLSDYEVRFISR